MRWMSCSSPAMEGNWVGLVISASQLPVLRLKTFSRSPPKIPNLSGSSSAMVMKATSDHSAGPRKSMNGFLVKLLVKQVCT